MVLNNGAAMRPICEKQHLLQVYIQEISAANSTAAYISYPSETVHKIVFANWLPFQRPFYQTLLILPISESMTASVLHGLSFFDYSQLFLSFRQVQ